MQRGLMVYPMGGTLDGVRGDHVLLAPPFIVEARDIDMIVDRLGDAVDAAIASVTLTRAIHRRRTAWLGGSASTSAARSRTWR